MKKTLYPLLSAVFFLPVLVFGQQEPMYTQYMFNKLLFNPACAGSNEHLTVNLMYRQQWVGFDGAPTTEAFTIHTPVGKQRVGIGLSIVRDKIGPTEVYDLYPSYAYRFPIGEKFKLSIGVQAGLTDWHADWFNVEVEQGTDEVFQHNITRWLTNFGTGAYLYSDKFYVGIGCPRLIEYNLRKSDGNQFPVYGRTYRHFYTTAGAAFPINDGSLVFRPSILIKTAGVLSSLDLKGTNTAVGAPMQFDFDASVFFRETLWVGLALRGGFAGQLSSAESVDFRTLWYLRNGLRLGASFDIGVNKIANFSAGSFEMMAGYEFDIKIRKVASPRYF